MNLLKFHLLLFSAILDLVLFPRSVFSACSANQVLFQGTCLSSCPTSYYLSTYTGECEACSFGCATCTGLKSSQCTACVSGFQKGSGGCYCFGRGFYSISAIQSNNTCASGYPLKNANGVRCFSCVSTCPNGYYVDAATDYECKPCATGCQTCYGSTLSTCLKCSNGYVWDPQSRTCLLTSCPYNNIVKDFCAQINCTQNLLYNPYSPSCVTNCNTTTVMPIDFTTPKGQCLLCDFRCSGGCVNQNSQYFCTGCSSGYEPLLQFVTTYNMTATTQLIRQCGSVGTGNVYTSLYSMKVNCLSHCSTCESTIEKCSKCSTRKYVTRDGDCIDYCPNITHQVIKYSGISYCYSTDDINVPAITSFNKAAVYVIPILNTIAQFIFPFTSSGFVRPIMFNLMVSMKYLQLDLTEGAAFAIGNMSLITPTIFYPTPDIFKSSNHDYFWAHFWPYLINYAVFVPFIVIAYYLNKGKEKIKSQNTQTFVKHYCDFFLLNFPIAFTLATMPDLILAMLMEFFEMGMGTRSVYFFYSLIFNTFYGVVILAGWFLVLLPTVCSAHSAMKSLGKLPERYDRVRVIYGDIKIETQRAMFFFFLFFIRAIAIIFVSIAFATSQGTCLIIRISIGGTYLLIHPLLRPYKNLRRAIEYFIYDIVVVFFDVIGYMNTKTLSNLDSFENVDMKYTYANMFVALLYAMMSLQIIFAIFELLSVFIKSGPKIQPSNQTQSSNADGNQGDGVIPHRDIQLLQEIPSGPSQTEGFRNNNPPVFNDSNGLAQQQKPESDDAASNPSDENANQQRDGNANQQRDREQNLRIPNAVPNNETPQQVGSAEGSIMRDFPSRIKDSHNAGQDGERLVDENVPRDFQGRKENRGGTKKLF